MSWEGRDPWRDEDDPPEPPREVVNHRAGKRSFCIATSEECDCPYGGATESHCAAKVLEPLLPTLNRHLPRW